MSIIKVRAALENGLMTLPGMVAITSSSVAASTVITTHSPHGLTTGMAVYIAGHAGSTPTINGNIVVTVTGDNTFTIPVTVTVAGTGGAFTVTEWQNARAFTPPAPSIPYQQAYLLTAEPDNPEIGGGYREQGIFQVSLRYPLFSGSLLSETRAELIRGVFYRGASFIKDTVTVTIEKTPEVGQGKIDGDRYFLPVRIRYYANIF